MPMYEYQCEDCGERFDRRLAIADYEQPQSCPSCGAENAKRLVSLSSFVLRGDGWAGKNNRIKNQMASKNRRLGSKQNVMKRDAPVTTLAPNVEGERVASWSEAKKLAASKGKNTTTYDAMVRKEKSAGGKR